ncbi:N-alpha-acetyltransferase 30-like [Ostrinia nubilalis]|uniref:N-alpha-acetyltransferase 30-like n=1 Tax=Ostrinia furnacalis TaxID=93504 RepID=UPI00103C731C|nr:N-alpha-acetyltransferase 30-like [Ostrinia furnacalis]
MHQVADGNVQSIKCSQMNANAKSKSKKAKDPSETTDDISILDQEKLKEVLANTLHINNLNNSNLTNGTSDHLNKNDVSNSSSVIQAQDDVVSDLSKDVNSVQCSDAASGQTEEPASVRHPSDTLESMEDSADTHDEAPREEIEIISYESELQMPEIMRLIQKDLSEPYSIYTYRYFIHNWPKLCFLATHEGTCIGAIVCKLDMHRNVVKRGYIAMLAVDEKYRKKKIGSRLVRKAIQAMINDNADEVVLETEITNKPALKLYENLGFVRDKRLFRYYLNGVDALRLKLWLR